MFQKTAVVFALTLLILAPVGCKSRGKTLAKVGGEMVTEADLDKVVRANPRLKGRVSSPEGKQKLLENYVEQLLLYQEGLRRNLHRDSVVKDRFDLYKMMIVAQAALDDELDKKVHEYYDNHKDEFEQLKLSHIYVAFAPKDQPLAKGASPTGKKPARTEAQAMAIAQGLKERLAKGEDFDKLAEQASEDDRTKKVGGSIGTVTIGDKRLEAWGWLPIAEKAFAMKEGEVSDPIVSRNGVHLIKVTEAKKMEPFDQAEGRVRFKIQALVRNDLLESLKKKTNIKYVEETPAPVSPAESKPTS